MLLTSNSNSVCCYNVLECMLLTSQRNSVCSQRKEDCIDLDDFVASSRHDIDTTGLVCKYSIPIEKSYFILYLVVINHICWDHQSHDSVLCHLWFIININDFLLLAHITFLVNFGEKISASWEIFDSCIHVFKRHINFYNVHGRFVYKLYNLKSNALLFKLWIKFKISELSSKYY